MRRGAVVLAAAQGDYGKPRPWLVVQADAIPADYPSVTLCPLSTETAVGHSFRIHLNPTPANGLRGASAVMVDKIQTLSRDKVRAQIGLLDAGTLRTVDTALRVWLGLT